MSPFAGNSAHCVQRVGSFQVPIFTPTEKGGIKYYSALRPGEANVVIFSPEKMRCTGVKKVRVVKSDMLHEECP